MAKVKTKFACTECGYESPKWLGKCPGCSAWNTMVEENRNDCENTRYGLFYHSDERKAAFHHTYRKW